MDGQEGHGRVNCCWHQDWHPTACLHCRGLTPCPLLFPCAAGPIATIKLPHMLPMGLHGSWTGTYLGPPPGEVRAAALRRFACCPPA
jgi:hypothetical protein